MVIQQFTADERNIDTIDTIFTYLSAVNNIRQNCCNLDKNLLYSHQLTRRTKAYLGFDTNGQPFSGFDGTDKGDFHVRMVMDIARNGPIAGEI